MPSDDIAISVRNLTKAYRIFNHPGDRLKQAISFGLKRYHREFIALDDVSLEIKKGETVGIVGRNGSGKSTLLQLVCGILKPTRGTVRVTGRVSALLELGAGFNPEFTGRENVFFQGALMGFTTRQMDERIDQILEFADIGEFIDQPVRTYSSGMYIRVAFAAAAHADPEILVVDEALAVGDVRFQSRCFRLFDELKAKGCTILFVSHSVKQIVQFCDRAILLDRGKFVLQGTPNDVTNQYLDLALAASMETTTAGKYSQEHQVLGLHELRDSFLSAFHSRPGYNPGEFRWGNRSAEILDFTLSGGTQAGIPRFDAGEKLELSLRVKFFRDVEHPIYGLTLKSPQGVAVFGTNSRDVRSSTPLDIPQRCGNVIGVSFSLVLHLTAGDYFLSVGVTESVNGELVPLDRRFDAIHIKVNSRHRHSGFADLAPIIAIVSESV